MPGDSGPVSRLVNHRVLAELAATIAWENHRVRLHKAPGVTAAGFSDGGYCAMPMYLTDAASLPSSSTNPQQLFTVSLRLSTGRYNEYVFG
jgi:hypothetical protein